MNAVRALHFESQLLASAPSVWAVASTMRGVNAELWPLLRMTHPAHADAFTSLVYSPGKTLFQSWLCLFGVIPVDRHAFALEQVLPGTGFDERSQSWSNRLWLHRRRVLPSAQGCWVHDTLEFSPRFSALAGPLHFFVNRLFTHRHQRLRKQFGHAP